MINKACLWGWWQEEQKRCSNRLPAQAPPPPRRRFHCLWDQTYRIPCLSEMMTRMFPVSDCNAHMEILKRRNYYPVYRCCFGQVFDAMCILLPTGLANQDIWETSITGPKVNKQTWEVQIQKRTIELNRARQGHTARGLDFVTCSGPSCVKQHFNAGVTSGFWGFWIKYTSRKWQHNVLPNSKLQHQWTKTKSAQCGWENNPPLQYMYPLGVSGFKGK